MIVRITIKVSNDHCSFSESFERESLILDPDSQNLLEMVRLVKAKFNAPVEEVKVKCSMDL